MEFGLRCPACGGQAFTVQVSAQVTLYNLMNEPTESEPYNARWNEESPATCQDCDYSATVADVYRKKSD